MTFRAPAVWLSLLFCVAGTLFPARGGLAAPPAEEKAEAKGAPPDAEGIAFFEKRIRPVLAQQCYTCHSAQAKKLRGELLLDTRAGVLAGGENGPAIAPGKPDESLLISALKHEDLEMPPEVKLPEAVIADFEKWIAMGAPDPRDGAAPAAAAGKQIDMEQGRTFWAFQPVRDPAPPQVQDADWPRDDIDRFVLAKLEAEGLHPVADADRLTLIRRVYYDLIGLPPSKQAIDAFLADNSAGAFEKVVDGLLASPQFGERWGRHWLDVAHFAESNGNVRNFTLPHAWRYRDWAIDAFNKDTPYDQFVTQQLAGDLLGGETPQQRNANKTATGFLTLCSKPQKGSTFEMDLIAEEIEVATRAFMGLTVSCARCHDHKFDPIPTEDYYALAGIFTSSQMLYGGTGANGSAPKTGLHVLESGDGRQKKLLAEHAKKIAALKQRLAEVKALQRQAGGKGKGKAKQTGAADAKVDAGQLKREAKQLAAQLKQLQRSGPQASAVAMGVRDADKCRDCQVYLQGEKPTGPAIPRGFIRVATIGQPPAIPPDASGRLQLAQWLTRGDHPLTARVMVNRIWHHLFGVGIVRTVDNFGINGERPSHPDLLDHLATRFMADGWSTKRMIRAIVLSRTYQLGSAHDAAAYAKDPDNQLLWRHARRRLDGEAIRDAILQASGQLDLTPPAGSVVAKVGDQIIRDGFTVDEFRVPSIHRSVYLPIIRNGLPELLNVFDFANPSLVVGRRDVTTVPTQALYLLNSPFVIEQSQHFARSLLEQADLTDQQRIEQAYWRALCRAPSDGDTVRAKQFINATIDNLQDAPKDAPAQTDDPRLTAWAAFCQALYVSAEFRDVK